MEKREIKFRGISEETKKMVFGCLVNNMWTYSELTQRKGEKVCEIMTGEYAGDCWEEAAFEDGCIVTVIPESVGQFTGQKDAVGNEIWEGDICEISGWSIKFVVIYDSNSSRFTVQKSDKTSVFDYIPTSTTRVVGNVHECDGFLNFK